MDQSHTKLYIFGSLTLSFPQSTTSILNPSITTESLGDPFVKPIHYIQGAFTKNIHPVWPQNNGTQIKTHKYFCEFLSFFVKYELNQKIRNVKQNWYLSVIFSSKIKNIIWWYWSWKAVAKYEYLLKISYLLIYSKS